jgi:hypothetical protein
VKNSTALIIGVLLLLTSCDPGITIRQTDSGNDAIATVTARVKTASSFIGTAIYAPSVEVTNISNAPIEVTDVELVTKEGTLQNKPRRSGLYPVGIASGKTQMLDIWFDLPKQINKTFKGTVELRVHYISNNIKQIAVAQLTVGHLNENRQ